MTSPSRRSSTPRLGPRPRRARARRHGVQRGGRPSCRRAGVQRSEGHRPGQRDAGHRPRAVEPGRRRRRPADDRDRAGLLRRRHPAGPGLSASSAPSRRQPADGGRRAARRRRHPRPRLPHRCGPQIEIADVQATDGSCSCGAPATASPSAPTACRKRDADARDPAARPHAPGSPAGAGARAVDAAADEPARSSARAPRALHHARRARVAEPGQRHHAGAGLDRRRRHPRGQRRRVVLRGQRAVGDLVRATRSCSTASRPPRGGWTSSTRGRPRSTSRPRAGRLPFVARTDDPSGGAEGSGPHEDTKDFTLD